MATTIKAPDIVPSADLLDLIDRTAIVTGGAMGIGLGIARRRHEAGASVVIADLDLAAGEEAAAALRHTRSDSALSGEANVTDAASVGAMVRRAVAGFGGVDIPSATPASIRCSPCRSWT